MVITGTVAPLASIAALGAFARDSGPEALAYVFTGNLVLTLMFENLNKVTSRFSYMRAVGNLDYYATLPIHRYLLVLAIVGSFLVLSLPALVVTALAGSLILGIQLAPHPLLLLVVPAAAVPLAGIGALIGCIAPNPQLSNSISTLSVLLLLALGPVIIPPDRLPPVMLLAGHLSPATYAASALRQTLLGPVTGRIALDMVALAAIALVVFLLVTRFMSWRQAA
jgi:ABC-2 type transport system permease protein